MERLSRNSSRHPSYSTVQSNSSDTTSQPIPFRVSFRFAVSAFAALSAAMFLMVVILLNYYIVLGVTEDARANLATITEIVAETTTAVTDTAALKLSDLLIQRVSSFAVVAVEAWLSQHYDHAIAVAGMFYYEDVDIITVRDIYDYLQGHIPLVRTEIPIIGIVSLNKTLRLPSGMSISNAMLYARNPLLYAESFSWPVTDDSVIAVTVNFNETTLPPATPNVSLISHDRRSSDGTYSLNTWLVNDSLHIIDNANCLIYTACLVDVATYPAGRYDFVKYDERLGLVGTLLAGARFVGPAGVIPMFQSLWGPEGLQGLLALAFPSVVLQEILIQATAGYEGRVDAYFVSTAGSLFASTVEPLLIPPNWPYDDDSTASFYQVWDHPSPLIRESARVLNLSGEVPCQFTKASPIDAQAEKGGTDGFFESVKEIRESGSICKSVPMTAEVGGVNTTFNVSVNFITTFELGSSLFLVLLPHSITAESIRRSMGLSDSLRQLNETKRLETLSALSQHAAAPQRVLLVVALIGAVFLIAISMITSWKAASSLTAISASLERICENLTSTHIASADLPASRIKEVSAIRAAYYSSLGTIAEFKRFLPLHLRHVDKVEPAGLRGSKSRQSTYSGSSNSWDPYLVSSFSCVATMEIFVSRGRAIDAQTCKEVILIVERCLENANRNIIMELAPCSTNLASSASAGDQVLSFFFTIHGDDSNMASYAADLVAFLSQISRVFTYQTDEIAINAAADASASSESKTAHFLVAIGVASSESMIGNVGTLTRRWCTQLGPCVARSHALAMYACDSGLDLVCDSMTARYVQGKVLCRQVDDFVWVTPFAARGPVSGLRLEHSYAFGRSSANERLYDETESIMSHSELAGSEVYHVLGPCVDAPVELNFIALPGDMAAISRGERVSMHKMLAMIFCSDKSMTHQDMIKFLSSYTKVFTHDRVAKRLQEILLQPLATRPLLARYFLPLRFSLPGLDGEGSPSPSLAAASSDVTRVRGAINTTASKPSDVLDDVLSIASRSTADLAPETM